MNPLDTGAAALNAAAKWRLRHAAGLTPTEQAEFDAWLAADPRHEAAWHEVGATLTALDRVSAAGEADAFVRELARRRRRRRQRTIAGSVLALAACAAILIVFTPRATEPVARADVAAPIIVRADERRLDDGSRVMLNAGAEISVNYAADRREVRLRQGEALFMVEPDPERPFIVVVDEVEVRAVGTAFAVRSGPTAVAVLVTEGRVAVAPAESALARRAASDASVAPVLVEAGRELSLVQAAPAWDSAVQPERLSESAIKRRLEWRQPRMQLAATPLEAAVAALNRENRTQIEIADPVLRRLPLTGIYRLDDADGFVHLLDTHFGIRAERRYDGTVVLRQG